MLEAINGTWPVRNALDPGFYIRGKRHSNLRERVWTVSQVSWTYCSDCGYIVIYLWCRTQEIKRLKPVRCYSLLMTHTKFFLSNYWICCIGIFPFLFIRQIITVIYETQPYENRGRNIMRCSFSSASFLWYASSIFNVIQWLYFWQAMRHRIHFSLILLLKVKAAKFTKIVRLYIYRFIFIDFVIKKCG